MALYGTHIRFALDVKDYFTVNDLIKYISGTVYPDSRYFSRIKRELTHSSQFEDKSFYNGDDFKKGWSVHLLYDHIQFDIISEIFSTLFSRQEIMYGNGNWITRTTIKLLQDLDDIKHFDIISYLFCLDYIGTPNGENEQIIQNYNNILVNLYKELPSGIDDYKLTWTGMGMEIKVVEAIKSKFLELEKNKEVMDKVKLIYPRSLEVFKSEWRG
ncbi:hypothetical protein IPN41_01440 [Candidatus Falkowbacteria bacterium]|nr:MAG: hypothetical protein IPN41_01440 [Candidatus Falkowbacteria bacterium]